MNNSVFSFPLKFLSNIIIYQSYQGIVDSVITHFFVLFCLFLNHTDTLQEAIRVINEVSKSLMT